MAQNQPTTQQKNHNHVLIGIIVILALAAVIGITVLFGNRYYDTNVEGRQQDTNEMSRLLAAITEYQTNNNGKFPSDAAKLKSDYIRGSFPYTISFTNLDEGETEKLPATSNTMYVIKNATCTNGSQAEYSKLARSFVIMYHPEGLASAICIE